MPFRRASIKKTRDLFFILPVGFSSRAYAAAKREMMGAVGRSPLYFPSKGGKILHTGKFSGGARLMMSKEIYKQEPGRGCTEWAFCDTIG